MDLAASAVMAMPTWRNQIMILSDQKVPLARLMPSSRMAVINRMSEPTCRRSSWVVTTCQGMSTFP